MRIALIAPLFESVPPKLYGGTERVVHNLACGLTEAGEQVTVFCSGDSRTSGTMEYVWPESLRLSSTKVHDSTAYQIRTLELVASQADRFDIIHNHYDYPLLPLTRMTDTPVVTTVHGRMDAPCQDLHAVYDTFLDAPLISISDAQRSPMEQLNWVATIRHGLDLSNFKFHEKPGSYLAFLGRLSPEKRPDLAIAIARRAGIPIKVAAKIDELNVEYFENKIKPLIDGRFVEYIGEIGDRDKCEFLGNALALLFPIDWPEPFGLVMAEAMACGTPVVACPWGSVPELVWDGVTGFIRNGVDELTKATKQAIELDRAKIRKYAEKKFSLNRMTQEHLDVYRQLIEQYKTYGPSNLRRMADHRRHVLYSVDRTADGHTKDIA